MNRLFLFLILVITMPCTDLVAQVEDIKYTIGDTWTYERFNDITKRTTFQEISIVDTLTINERSCYLMDRGLVGNIDTMCVAEKQIYFYDFLLQDYQLQYDFDSESYACAYISSNANGLDSFYVFRDSVKTVLTSNGKLVDKYFFRSTWGYDNPSSEFTIVAYENIGNIVSHPHLATGGLEVDNFQEYNTILRCFQSDTSLYQFVDYACDSMSMFVSVDDDLLAPISIYPNPTTGSFTISGLDNGSYVKLYNIEGQLFSMSVYKGTELHIDNPGIYFIRMRQRGKIVTQKIVVH